MNEKAAVLDVGNCDPDHAMIRRMLTDHFDVQVDRVMFVDEALDRMIRRRYRLVLLNRLIFADSSPGIDLLKRVPEVDGINPAPVMLISNFPEAQAKAVAEGAVLGFGKDSIGASRTLELLADYLPQR